MKCAICGEEILEGPCVWYPDELRAEPLDILKLPLRRQDPTLYVRHELAGGQVMNGEPYIELSDGRRCHIRCQPK